MGRAYQNTIAILLLSEFFGNKILFFFHICKIILQHIAILPRRKMQKTMNWKQLLKIIFVNTFFHGINVPKFMIVMKKKLHFQISRQHIFPIIIINGGKITCI